MRIKRSSIVCCVAIFFLTFQGYVLAGVNTVLYVDVEGKNSAKNHTRVKELFSPHRECAGAVLKFVTVPIDKPDAWNRALSEEIDALDNLVVVASGAIAKVAFARLKNSTIVFQTHSDAVADGFVQDLNRPGGRATGVSYYSALRIKQVELLLDFDSRIQVVGLIADQFFLESIPSKQLIALEQSFGIRFVQIPANNASDLDEKLNSVNIDAALVPYSLPVFQDAIAVVRLLSERGVPTVHERMAFLKFGATFVLEPSGIDGREELMKRIGLICRGLSAGTIPVARFRYLQRGASITAVKKFKKDPEPFFWRLFDVIAH